MNKTKKETNNEQIESNGRASLTTVGTCIKTMSQHCTCILSSVCVCMLVVAVLTITGMYMSSVSICTLYIDSRVYISGEPGSSPTNVARCTDPCTDAGVACTTLT